MGFRFRRSIKIAPGVRLNLSKRGVGVSAGVRGARYSLHSSGRRTRTLSIPSTGLSWVETSTARRRSSGGGAQRPNAVAATTPKPGLLAPSWEKALWRAAIHEDADPMALERFAVEHPDHTPLAAALAGVSLAADPAQLETARSALSQAFAFGEELANHPFVLRYLPHVRLLVHIAAGVTAELPMSLDAVGLLLAELHQAAGDVATAIEVVEQVEPTAHAAVSLAELYLEAGRLDDVVALTNEVRNEDDATALLLTLRGAALRRLNHLDAAKSALTDALRARSRAAPIRHLALWERAAVHVGAGRGAQARKDLERILADDASYPGLSERLAQLAE